MAQSTDVVVIGGGIAGASLASSLAAAGLGVTILEATDVFADRVRGESMQPWGVREARTLGVEQVLLDAGAHTTLEWRIYTEGFGVTGVLPVGMMIPEIPGSLNLRHPTACQALLDAAAGAGATVVRDVRGVTVTPGPEPSVSYAVGGEAAELRPSLVVGADGRNSTVRKQVGITPERQPAISYIAGLLLDGLDDVPTDHDVVVEEGDQFFLLFHQGNGRARVYVCTGESRRHDFAGPQATEHFLAACGVATYPWSEQVVGGTPAGPCASYPGDDTWVDAPYVDGVVLIGDAAGHNDPIIGQGLAIAMRDARTVRDLVLEGARVATAFSEYGAERIERMRCLRFLADVMAVTQAEDAVNRAARRAFVNERLASMDSEVFPVLVAAFTGPETVPAELIDEGLLDRIRAA
jgi:2-polyprenyl-6-methoxyphenol hydroxylase-like FAD-dependent oxidoreductase